MGDVEAKVFASNCLTNLPDEDTLRKEISTTQRVIQFRSKETSVPKARGGVWEGKGDGGGRAYDLIAKG
jgi:hypothetical protein